MSVIENSNYKDYYQKNKNIFFHNNLSDYPKKKNNHFSFTNVINFNYIISVRSSIKQKRNKDIKFVRIKFNYVNNKQPPIINKLNIINIKYLLSIIIFFFIFIYC